MNGTFDGSLMNELFIADSGSKEGQTKIAEATTGVIRDHLREESIADRITPSRQVQRSELQVSDKHDTLYKMEEMEPNSTAMVVTFRGTGRPQLVRAGRYPVGFFKITSPLFEKYEMELMAYGFPITKHIEKNIPKDMGDVYDREVVFHWESAVQQLQYNANGNAYVSLTGTTALSGSTVQYGVVKGELAKISSTQTSYVPLQVQSRDLTNLFKLFPDSSQSGGRLRVDKFLLGDGEFEDLMDWTLETFGNKVASEVIVDGYKYNLIKGRKFVRTVKTDIIREGVIYAFSDAEFGARNYILQNIKFWIDKEAELISWRAWMYRGYGIGNIAWVRKCELWPASSITTMETNATTALTRLPRDASALGGENNRVDSGQVTPSIDIY